MSDRLTGVGMMGVGVVVGVCVGETVGESGACVDVGVAATRVGAGVDVAMSLAIVEGCAGVSNGALAFVLTRRSSGASSEQARANMNAVISTAAKYP